jgi:hypothetical protein
MQLLLGNRDRSRECETRTKQNSRGGLGGTRTTLSGYTHAYVSNLYNMARVGDGDDAGKSRCCRCYLAETASGGGQIIHSPARSGLRMSIGAPPPPPHARHRMDRRHRAGESMAKNAHARSSHHLAVWHVLRAVVCGLYSNPLSFSRAALTAQHPQCVSLAGSFKIRCH